jgi:hypothetical protein
VQPLSRGTDTCGRFEVLADKRRGRCWSPARYADGASSRGNAGVAEVSALVFDCDRVAPDPERLKDVYWLGHTTWSHIRRRHAGAWSSRSRRQCQVQSGATSGSAHAPRCAPRRTQPAKTWTKKTMTNASQGEGGACNGIAIDIPQP